MSRVEVRKGLMLGVLTLVVAALPVLSVAQSAARSQTPLCTTDLRDLTIWSPGGSKVNAPYSGTVKTTFVQELPDGNSIHAVFSSREARDSSGRTMTEDVKGCPFGEDGQKHERLTVTVRDPIARTTTDWSAGIGDIPAVARVTHLDVPQPEPTPPDEELAMLARRQKAFEAAMSHSQREYKYEDLGVRQINGMSARGTRTTRTIPAGDEGNDRPLAVVNETWRAADYDLLLYAMQDDPRRGRTTMELEELKMGEPDRALFKPPAGYTVQDGAQSGTAAH